MALEGQQQRDGQEGANGAGAGAGAAGGAAGANEGQQQGGAPAPGRVYGTATREPIGGPASGSEEQGGAAAGAQGARPGAAAGARRPTTSDLSPETLSSRLNRAKATGAAQVEERYRSVLGDTDPVKIKERLDRAAQLEAEAEERRRAEMSEADRMRADLEAERQRVAELNAQLEEERNARLYEKQDREITSIAATMVDPKALRLARLDFAEHLKSIDPKKIEKMTDRDVKKFFTDWVKENPTFALQQVDPAKQAGAAANGKGAPAGAAARPPVARKPITNGAPPRRQMPPPASRGADPSTASGKTARPGQPNSMSKAEVKEFARRHGVNYPG